MKKRLLSTTLPVRREYLPLMLLMLVVSACQSSPYQSDSAVVITEEMHNNTSHFKVESDLATYFIAKQSGGCSSLLDKEGRDWVGFRLTGNEGPVAGKFAPELNDFFCYMGNNQELGNASPDGMNVFGFGRSLTTTPLMEGPNSFYMGLFPQQVSDQKAVKQLNNFIQQLIH